MLKAEIIFGKGDKKAVCRFNAVAGDAPEDLVFSNTLARGLSVSDRIAGTAVQQTVVTPRCAGGDVVALQKRDAQSPQGAVACDAGTRRATANDNHIAEAWIVNCHCLSSMFVF